MLEKIQQYLSNLISMIEWNYKTILIIVLIVFTLGLIAYSKFQSKRVYYASRFGKSEHWAGRTLGVLLIIEAFIIYFGIKFAFIGIIVCFVCWFIYLTSHTIEKKLYGHYGPRG